MELKYLRTLKTILEVGSFAGAARNLNYTQSTVTFQVQQLEQELHVQLFEKIGRRMILTEQGKALLPLVDEVLQSTEKLQNFGRSTSELTGMLRVAAPESLILYRMQPVLQAFRRKAPGVRLILRSMNCYAVKEYVMQGQADLGIQYDVGGYRPGAVTDVLAEYPVTMIMSPEEGATAPDFSGSHKRFNQCLLINDPEAIYQQMLDQLCQRRFHLFSNVLELGSIEAIKRCVASDMGVAVLPEIAVAEELWSGALRHLPSPMDGETIRAISLYHKNKVISAPMELFLRLVKEYF